MPMSTNPSGENAWGEGGNWDEPPVPPIPPELIAACGAKDCVLFAGGGIGAQAGLPTWGEALEKLISMAEKRLEEPGEWTSLRAGLQTNQSVVAELIGSRVPRDILLKFVREIYEHPVAVMPPIFRILNSIPFASVITTNWDTCSSRASVIEIRRFCHCGTPMPSPSISGNGDS